MCQTHHPLELEILKAQADAANRLRRYCAEKGVLLVDIIGSPGSGKTALLEATVPLLRGKLRLAAIEGDPETNRDAQRLSAAGMPAIQITTGQACHLEAAQVEHALETLADKVTSDTMAAMPIPAGTEDGVEDLPFDIVFIENVGNLVCPALYDLGQHIRVVVLSTAEGHDKPKKYPKAFHTSQVMIVSKTDLLGVLDFDPDQAIEFAREAQPGIEVLRLASRKGEGVQAWVDLLTRHLSLLRSQGAGHAAHPHDHDHDFDDHHEHPHPHPHPEASAPAPARLRGRAR